MTELHGAHKPEEILARKQARFPKERTLGSEPVRQVMLSMYRQGASHADVARAFNVSVNTVTKEGQVDPAWKARVQEAMAGAFRPIYEHAQKLALQLDPLGAKEGSMKAMELIFRYYSKALDRDLQRDLLERKIEATTEVMEKAAGIPTLTTPGQVAELLVELQRRSLPSGIEDAEVVSDDAED